VSRGAPARARTATLVTLGPAERLGEAAEVLAALDGAGSLRHVVLSTSAAPLPPFPGLQDVTAIENLPPPFLNNAIAALRLSSLPTIVWWRGGPADALDGAAALADRVVLDAEDPTPLWRRAAALFEQTALTDLRWARLTRWRGLMALLFDLPQVREAAPSFERLTLIGTDPDQCRLFAGWLDASLGWDGRVPLDVRRVEADAALSDVRLEGAVDLHLRLLANGTCLAMEAAGAGGALVSRVVPVGDVALPALLSQELRVRSRDLAFEQALQHAPGATRETRG
jgi:glucose-6-phosphate dehydrogenase assembly protein OpcA